MKISNMKQVLTEEGIQLTKSLGQNFLHDARQLQRIAAAGELTQDDQVLEVGPGLGPLTDLLLQQAGTVHSIEKDQRLIDFLKKRFAGKTNFTLEHADALRIVEDYTRDWTRWKMISNLPYSVASPLLVDFSLMPHGPERMVVTLQREVARRIAAPAGHEDYGILTLLIQLRYEPKGQFRIPAGCFFPSPNVESACLTLRRRATIGVEEAQVPLFAQLVKCAFSQRRKMMHKLLKAAWPVEKLDAAFAAVGLASGVRAETVSLAQFCQLTRHLAT